MVVLLLVMLLIVLLTEENLMLHLSLHTNITPHTLGRILTPGGRLMRSVDNRPNILQQSETIIGKWCRLGGDDGVFVVVVVVARDDVVVNALAYGHY